MGKKIGLNANGIVVNKRPVPPLKVSPSTRLGKKFVRLHRLISGQGSKVCIIRGEGIGDLIMTTPIAQFLHEQYPGVEVTYATNTSYLGGALPASLENNPYVQKVINWDVVKEEDYDVIVNLGGGTGGHCPAVPHEIPLAPPVNRIDLFARYLGIELTHKIPTFVVTEKERKAIRRSVKMKSQIDIAKEQVLVVNPYASNAHRSPRPEMLHGALQLIRERSPEVKVIVLKHSSDFDKDTNWDAVADAVLKDSPVRKAAALLSYANLLICPDSALLHVAGALLTPTLALFGPTDPRARVNHYPSAIAYCPGMDLHCFPCWYSKSDCGHRTCWLRMRPDEVATLVVKLLDGRIKVGSAESAAAEIKSEAV